MMTFQPVGTSDARLIKLESNSDSRGKFVRTWSVDEFTKAGIDFNPVEASTSLTHMRGTVRGMHFQRAPREEAKIVRCTRGKIFDAIADLRPRSPNFRESFSVELAGDDATMLFVPAGFAHGFQTLTDDVAVEYLMSERYARELADGFRYDDPDVGIRWPLPTSLVSERDLAWTPLSTRTFWYEPTPLRDLATTP